MKIPKSVKIGGHLIKVFQRPHLLVGGKCVGYADHITNQIIVSTHNVGGLTKKKSRYADSQQAVFFLHEVLHHISEIYQCQLKETSVGRLAEGLYQVLRDNDLPCLRRRSR